MLVTVDDGGPGIPDDKLTAIFDRFYTERPAGEKFGTHSGLGLSISKQIVEAHRGMIWAENRKDRRRRRGRRALLHPPAGASVSETLFVHATAVAIDGEAVLLRGPSGAGKSDLALRLIDGGGALVADDQTLLRRVGERVLVRAPPAIAGLIEFAASASSDGRDRRGAARVDRRPDPFRVISSACRSGGSRSSSGARCGWSIWRRSKPRPRQSCASSDARWRRGPLPAIIGR